MLLLNASNIHINLYSRILCRPWPKFLTLEEFLKVIMLSQALAMKFSDFNIRIEEQSSYKIKTVIYIVG